MTGRLSPRSCNKLRHPSRVTRHEVDTTSMDYKTALLDKIHHHQATVAVIGLGYVGLPLAVTFAKNGFPVIGIDVDEEKVAAVNRGESYVEDVRAEDLAEVVRGDDEPWTMDDGGENTHHHRPSSIVHRHLRATTDYAALDAADVAIICVPTPLNKTRDPDVRYIMAAAEAIAEHMHPGMLVILESTTYPGTTEELLLPMLSRAPAFNGDGRVGRDFFLAFSPERIDPGNKEWPIERVPKVVGGVTPACLELVAALYGQIVDRVVPVSSPAVAEMVKLLENTFRVVNIALVNEIAIMCDKLGLDVWEVIEAATTKPYGFMKFTPGPGIGGHCIPVDPHYLSWKLKLLNYNARFVQLAAEINSEMPRYWVGKVVDALNEQGKAVKGSRVLVLGVSYKRDVGDIRESPALDIIELLRQKGADVRYHDPYVPSFSHNGHTMTSVPNEALWDEIANADCVLIATDHSKYDWEAVRQKAKVIVDTRGVLSSKEIERRSGQ